MLRLASVRSNAGILVRLQHFVVVLLILIPFTALATDGSPQAPNYKVTQILLTPKDGAKPISFSVRLAVTSSQHAYGLMFSPPLAANSGMLFLFKDMKPRTFWMKNTPIALDLLFFDGDGRLVTLIPFAAANSLVLRHSRVPAKYVLEIGGGEAARLNLILGTRLHLPIEDARKSDLIRKK